MNFDIQAVNGWLAHWPSGAEVRRFWGYLTRAENEDLITALASAPFKSYWEFPYYREDPEYPAPCATPLLSSSGRAAINARRVHWYRFSLRAARAANTELPMPIDQINRLNEICDLVDRELGYRMTGAYSGWLFERLLILSRAALGLEVQA